MPGIVAGALVAHPPVLVSEVGGASARRVEATGSALRRLDGILSRVPVDLVIVISPHGPASVRELPVRRGPQVAGDLGRFRASRVRVAAEVDLACATRLVSTAEAAGFPLSWSDDRDLDHGVVVPFHFLPRTTAGRPCLFLGISDWPLARFQEVGAWLHAQLQDREVLLVASGDLSHRLTRDAPYGFNRQGPVFDGLVVDGLRSQQWERIETMDPDLADQAGECGLRPLAMLLGAARVAGLHSEVLSYEGPFGVGYPVVHFGHQAPVMDMQELGRRAIATYLRERRIIEPPEPVPSDLQAPSAVFVTLRRHGELRGCMGSIRPVEPSAVREVIRYAIASALRDPRFDPVELDEVPELTVSVQLLDPPEPVDDPHSLNPAVYGVIVRQGDRQALLLPGIEGIDTTAQQFEAACDKAGIDPRTPVMLERFRTRSIE